MSRPFAIAVCLVVLCLVALPVAPDAGTPARSLASPETPPAVPTDQPADERELLLARARFELASGNEKAAIPILRDYVDQVPQDLEAQLDLARALAWSGRYAESLYHYENVIAPPSLAAGIPVVHPDLKADAIAGIGDVLAWSGRKAEARQKYNEALGLNPGAPEIVEAQNRLDEEASRVVQGEHEHFYDSSRLMWDRSTVHLDAGEARSAAFFVTVLRDQLELAPEPALDEEDAESGAGGLAGSGSLEGGGVQVGQRRDLGRGLTLKYQLGATWFERDAARGMTGIALSQQTLRGLSWSVEHSYGVRGYELRSLEARGLVGHEGAVGAYHALGAGFDASGRLRGGFLSDENRYVSAEASLGRPLGLGLRALAEASAQDYGFQSERYYAPAREWSAAAGVEWAAGGGRPTHARARFLAGRGGNRFERGEDLELEVQVGWRLAGALALEGRYSYAQSVRTDAYISRLAAAGIRIDL